MTNTNRRLLIANVILLLVLAVAVMGVSWNWANAQGSAQSSVQDGVESADSSTITTWLQDRQDQHKHYRNIKENSTEV